MALSKVNFNSMNVTPAASKAIKFNSSNNGLETGDIDGSLVLLSTQTASSSSTITFDSGIDSTYKEYIFKFINIHPATDNVNFQVNFRDGGSDFDATKTTTSFLANHTEAGGGASLSYSTGLDLAQATGYLSLNENTYGTDADASLCGEMFLFSPSSTTFVKHFVSRFSSVHEADYAFDIYVAGYFNTTSAVNAMQFKMASGNIDSGVIKMYGLTK